MHPITAGRAVVVVPLGDADLALARLIAQQESKSGTPLNLSGLQILHELRVEPQLSIPEIARYLRITEGEVRSGIARMVDAGLTEMPVRQRWKSTRSGNPRGASDLESTLVLTLIVAHGFIPEPA